MPSKSMHKWVSTEMERLSMKLERFKPASGGYNRMQPVLLSKSVTQMLNNPLPVEDQIGGTTTSSSNSGSSSTSAPQDIRARGVLSRNESAWEEVYPTVKFSRSNSRESEPDDGINKFAYYRNCATRLT